MWHKTHLLDVHSTHIPTILCFPPTLKLATFKEKKACRISNFVPILILLLGPVYLVVLLLFFFPNRLIDWFVLDYGIVGHVRSPCSLIIHVEILLKMSVKKTYSKPLVTFVIMVYDRMRLSINDYNYFGRFDHYQPLCAIIYQLIFAVN